MAEMKRLGINPDNNEDVLEYQNEVRLTFCRRIKEIVGNDIRCILNGIPWDEHIHSHVELECLPSGDWGYEYVHATAPYGRTRFDDLMYMSGRFQDSWGDFGGMKTIAAMENDMYDAMMHSYGLSFGDHLHPIDGLEEEVISRIGKVFSEKMQYELFDDGAKCVVEIGVLVECGECFADTYAKGFAKMLCELKLPYNIYDANGNISGLKLLIVPKILKMDALLAEKLCNFVDKGGKILFVGSAIDLGVQLSLLNFIELIGEDTCDNAYFTLPESTMRWASYKPSRQIKNIGGQELSKYVAGITSQKWDGEHAYFYTPQGELTSYSTAVVGENAACICFDAFGAYAEKFLFEIKALVQRVIDQLLPERFIRTVGFPSWATISVTENVLNRIIHVKATHPEQKNRRGIIEEHSYLKSGKISVEGEYQVYSLPDMKTISATQKEGRTEFETGDFLGYRAFSLRN